MVVVNPEDNQRSERRGEYLVHSNNRKHVLPVLLGRLCTFTLSWFVVMQIIFGCTRLFANEVL